MFANRYTALGLLCMALGACTPQMDAYDAGQMRLVRSTATVDQNRQSVNVLFDAAGNAREQDVRSTIQALTLLGDPLTTHAMIEGATSAAQRSIAARFLQNFGVPRANIAFSGTAAQGAGVSLVMSRYTVTVPECPAWDDLLENYVSNGPTIPLGCANARNLGLMVEDPRDLLVGRTTGPTDAGHEVKAIERYMEDKVKPLPSNNTTSTSSFEGS
jgi:pilus assembly protein CpaD